jgi:hypothetical protein
MSDAAPRDDWREMEAILSGDPELPGPDPLPPADPPSLNGTAAPPADLPGPNPVPSPQPRALCGAKCRDGRPCRQWAMANGRCKMHGGKTPRGICSPHFKDGKRSRYLAHVTGTLRDAYTAAMSDPRLLELTADVALLTGRVVALLNKGRDDPTAVDAVWAELPRLLALRGKLTLMETERAAATQALLPVSAVVEFGNIVLRAAHAIITDADVLARFQERVVALLPRPDLDREGQNGG